MPDNPTTTEPKADQAPQRVPGLDTLRSAIKRVNEANKAVGATLSIDQDGVLRASLSI